MKKTLFFALAFFACAAFASALEPETEEAIKTFFSSERNHYIEYTEKGGEKIFWNKKFVSTIREDGDKLLVIVGEYGGYQAWKTNRSYPAIKVASVSLDKDDNLLIVGK